MPVWLSEEEYRTLEAVCDVLVPADDDGPGAVALGAVDYIDGLLGAFAFDPPRIWAGGPSSGRHGGPAGFARFHRLNALDELAWRTRIEGSRGLAEREFNGPVVGWQERYRSGLAALGPAFAGLEAAERLRRLEDHSAFADLVFEHACEGMYGAPEYGGNPGGAGWELINFPGDVQPRGWSDPEVAEP